MTEISIPPGISRGATPSDRPGRWYQGNLIRWYDNVLQAVGGWQRLTSTPLTSPVRRLMALRSNTDIKYLVAACDNGLIILDGDTVFNATPVGFGGAGSGTLPDGYGTGLYGIDGPSSAYGLHRAVGTSAYLRGYSYSLDNWGEDLLSVHSSDGKLLRWTPTAPTTKAAAITGAPTGNRCMIVTPERHVMLFGLGGSPRRIGWCSREDYTDWNFASATNTAGFFDLDSESMIVAAAEVREGMLAFCDESVWLVNYLGGDFIYGRQRIGTTTLLAPSTIATFGGRCAWMSRSGSFYLYDAGQVQPLSCDLAAYIQADMDAITSTNKAFASEQSLHGEVWFWYVSKNSISGECDKYVIWSYLTNTWSMGTLDRTAMVTAGAHRYPLMAGVDNHLYEHENGYLDGTASRVGSIYIETAAISAGGQMRVQRMEMDGGVINQTRVTLTARDTRDGNGTEILYGPFTPNADGRTPIRAGGKDIRVRIEPTTDDPTWSIGRFLADVVPVGNR